MRHTATEIVYQDARHLQRSTSIALVASAVLRTGFPGLFELSSISAMPYRQAILSKHSGRSEGCIHAVLRIAKMAPARACDCHPRHCDFVATFSDALVLRYTLEVPSVSSWNGYPSVGIYLVWRNICREYSTTCRHVHSLSSNKAAIGLCFETLFHAFVAVWRLMLVSAFQVLILLYSKKSGHSSISMSSVYFAMDRTSFLK